MTPEVERGHLGSFEAVGESAVRANLATHKYGFGTEVHKLALRWLADREAARQDVELGLARRAAEAAEASAKAARGSEQLARYALYTAIAAAIVSVIAIVLK